MPKSGAGRLEWVDTGQSGTVTNERVCVCAYTNVFIVLLQLRHCPVSREKERKRE